MTEKPQEGWEYTLIREGKIPAAFSFPSEKLSSDERWNIMTQRSRIEQIEFVRQEIVFLLDLARTGSEKDYRRRISGAADQRLIRASYLADPIKNYLLTPFLPEFVRERETDGEPLLTVSAEVAVSTNRSFASLGLGVIPRSDYMPPATPRIHTTLDVNYRGYPQKEPRGELRTTVQPVRFDGQSTSINPDLSEALEAQYIFQGYMRDRFHELTVPFQTYQFIRSLISNSSIEIERDVQEREQHD
ncbi:hypothetical protein HY469_01900 [Candidatus Roizmanbacteria bacterium]|nr:hypothetical protein [Candidatus Roizmanbacteria bacterium]